VPAQCVFLFCNLDEPDLFSAHGSTGLAAGTSNADARLRALMEIFERDAEGTQLYHPSRCFTLAADHPGIASLLEDYRAKKIHIQFQEITTGLGLPCYKCFVIDADGNIVKGTGADLDGRRALLSALMETPHPYPRGPATRPVPEGLEVRRFEDLPNYSTRNREKDLQLVEALLHANGYAPIYVDITREDLDIPVVRAIVAGMVGSADFDRWARVHPRLFHSYLEWYG
jgi:ribosomal protein S12 methylthiotransferase accessory factor